MKDMIQRTLEQAEVLDEEIQRLKESLGQYEGEQLTEVRTVQQLDRWNQEQDLGDSVDTALLHMAKVLEELRRIRESFQM